MKSLPNSGIYCFETFFFPDYVQYSYIKQTFHTLNLSRNCQKVIKTTYIFFLIPIRYSFKHF
jgi:hypothetical protein